MSELWKQAKQDFEPDGALRDIYVQRTNLGDWEELLVFLKENSPELKFWIGQQLNPIPASAAAIFERNLIERSLLQVDWSGVHLNCHFFSEVEIEFDFDPREIATAQTFEQLITFIKQLGQALRREVIVTYENLKEATFLRFDPYTDLVQFIPSQYFREA